MIMRQLSVCQWVLISTKVYLLMSTNFLGIFAHGVPSQYWIHRRSSQPFNQNSQEDLQASSSHVNNAKVNIYKEDVPSHQIHSVSAQSETALQNSGAIRSSGNADQLTGEATVKLKLFQPINVAGDQDVLDLSSIGPNSHPPMESMPSAMMDPLQVLRHNLDKVDMYGDYDYIDPSQYPKRVEFHRPLRHHPYHKPSTHPRGRIRNGPPAHTPALPRRRADLRFPGENPYNSPVRRYQRFRPPQVHHHRPPFIRHPYRPRPLAPPRRQVMVQSGLAQPLRPHATSGPPFSIPTSPFGLANSLLSFVKGEGIGGQFAPGPTAPAPLPEDADYFADVENDVYSPYYRPPTLMSRVIRWFDDFKPPPGLLNPKLKSAGPPRRQNNVVNAPLDYSQYDTGDDENLVFFQNDGGGDAVAANQAITYDFSDVIESLKRNESEKEVLKKLFGAASAFTERSASSPSYMFWTVPTTLLAIFGAFYFFSAIAIIGYQSTLGDGNGNILPTIIALAIPAILAFLFVISRETISGLIDVQRVMRGDMSNSMRSDFDGVDVVMDAAFGSASILGVAWLASIIV
ncbi:hypothetical protein TCAL_04810 [Tigriopus californicus]|uniref:Uncharacterized protein n=1 Tax=Tigriopus californicus TaxID=6832 RepID=A0A553PTC7_TIGCA|nr:uncharacterized protein LOC131892356 [Tigriopus californicus]XP_059098170.1 uncharacterized protein LOC131892356 [Tigriopus californicus]XP_059098171.1 uncharacterized protein LOC131892356 [Tigriopus californicus]XP_059098172.1 uncharacterized protein LOC131892356 [Tigriopus californicus]TRY80938.1 hypothetical protein TCAL_04810 [Tigriopus californicus]|eukprot:TCALIF_04810-PA protein Name:"Protein of unknown function" AED:0.00 eAED:0.00 QI:117/1/1/1/0.6/0.66/6/394/570